MPKLKQRSLVPEPGLWVADDLYGLGVQPPEPLPNRRLGTREVGRYVAYEGLGFCVFEYISPERIADRKLARLWIKARTALQEIVEYLESASVTKPVRVSIGKEITR